MKQIIVQYGCCFISAVLSSKASFIAVWPSYAIEILKSDQSPLGTKITQLEGSLISSIPMLGSLLAVFVAGYLTDKMGRKRTQILCGLLYVLSWALIVTARSSTLVIISRFISGMGAGTSIVAVIVQISEITQLSIRGSAAAVTSLMYNIGILVSYLLGWFCSYDMVCYISLVAAVVYVLIMSWFKETPSYLLMMGKEQEALSSLKFYRGETKITKEILEELSYLKNLGTKNDAAFTDAEKPILQTEKEKSLRENLNIENAVENDSSWKLLWSVPHNRRALVNSVTFTTLTVLMGMVAVQTYADKIFATAAPSLSPNLCSVLFATVLVFSSGSSMVCTNLFPRRVTLITTCGLASVCLAVLGGVIRWPGAPTWVAITAVVVYCIVFQLGGVNLVFVQLSECYGSQVISAASAIILCFMFAANFMVLFLFESSTTYLGLDGTFFLFAIVAAITSFMSFFFTKETRRTPLETIQKMYDDGYLYRKIYKC